jgi:hypothetical protein
MPARTLANLQTRIHYILEADTAVPESTEDDYTLRTGLINAAIDAWQHSDGVRWPELYTEQSSQIGDGSDTTFTLPANFRELTGYVQVRVGDAYDNYQVIPVHQAHALRNGSISEKYCYVSGSPGSYVLNFSVAPDDDATIYIPYYKYATELASASDVSECPDPDFLVYYALAELYKADTNLSGFNAARQEAESRLSQMRFAAAGLPHYPANALPDITAGLGD